MIIKHFKIEIPEYKISKCISNWKWEHLYSRPLPWNTPSLKSYPQHHQSWKPKKDIVRALSSLEIYVRTMSALCPNNISRKEIYPLWDVVRTLCGHISPGIYVRTISFFGFHLRKYCFCSQFTATNSSRVLERERWQTFENIWRKTQHFMNTL